MVQMYLYQTLEMYISRMRNMANMAQLSNAFTNLLFIHILFDYLQTMDKAKIQRPHIICHIQCFLHGVNVPFPCISIKWYHTECMWIVHWTNWKQFIFFLTYLSLCLFCHDSVSPSSTLCTNECIIITFVINDLLWQHIMDWCSICFIELVMFIFISRFVVVLGVVIVIGIYCRIRWPFTNRRCHF